MCQKLLQQKDIATEERDGKIVIPALPKEHIAAINELLVANHIKVFEIGIIRNDLESIFIDLVK
jgi:hypothetical protein